ncbi:hypothetical protein [Runella sp. SP2]|uniref:hypothetical protein n=1 Tax=Runella sp. SP2 TaxID=2268026 RepID=UPI000F07AB23|nr:hypothetical protein [Runella sp. SP2]AYQ36603.1 hypothetical protein DTQ70_30240 [Runella sp. SP2]
MTQRLIGYSLGMILLLVSFLPATNLVAQSNCQWLIRYRDQQLFVDFNRAFTKAELYGEACKDFQHQREALLADTRWVTSSNGELVAHLAQVTKTTCSLLGDLLIFAPATGIPTRTVTTIYKLIKTGATAKSLSDNVEKAGYQTVLKTSNIGKTVVIAWNWAENIVKHQEIANDRASLKAEVARLLGQLDQQLANTDIQLRNSKTDLAQIEQVKQGIDQYLRENCP